MGDDAEREWALRQDLAEVQAERDHYLRFLCAMAADSGTPFHIRESALEVLEEGPEAGKP